MDAGKKRVLRDKTRVRVPPGVRLAADTARQEMFRHGLGGYMRHAFPADELDPVACAPLLFDRSDPDNTHISDVHANCSLTLIDALDTIAIIEGRSLFEHAVRVVLAHVSFDSDVTVQVFETTIRVLGGLLSAHILATDPAFNTTLPHYRGELLQMALDLGERLLPAFQATATGIPYPRVNLKYGVYADDHGMVTCSAAVGSLILEFGTLSRLSGDPRFEHVALAALQAVWDRRNDMNLVGSFLRADSGQWVDHVTGVGASIDSYYEYLLKAYVLFGDDAYLRMFEQAYRGILDWTRDTSGYLYFPIDFRTGKRVNTSIQSLAAFLSGLQVLYGDLENAIRGHMVYAHVWLRLGALPESYDVDRSKVDAVMKAYPLRPELAESTYSLYRATKDPFYLELGEVMLRDIDESMRTSCGFAGLGDVEKKTHQGRMDSFFLGETLKYLYLLFDEEHILNTMASHAVFSTGMCEAHLLKVPYTPVPPDPEPMSMPAPVCDVYRPGATSLAYRTDMEWVRRLSGYEARPGQRSYVAREFRCTLPEPRPMRKRRQPPRS